MNKIQKQEIIEQVTGFGAIWDVSTKSFLVHTNKKSVDIDSINKAFENYRESFLTVLVVKSVIVNDKGNLNLQISES